MCPPEDTRLFFCHSSRTVLQIKRRITCMYKTEKNEAPTIYFRFAHSNAINRGNQDK